MSGASDSEPGEPRVFVHLAYGFDVRTWEAAWTSGSLIGFNARTPYGYHLAEAQGCRVTFSRDRPEGRLRRLARLGIRAVLGFDLVHAWRNRRGLADAQVVWTHTESQFGAVALLLLLAGRSHAPKLLGQAVWLVDRWERQGMLRRALWRLVMRRVDVLTLHSPLNLARAQVLFPSTPSELVLFGIPTDGATAPPVPRTGRPARVIAVGNDEHRDWDTLLAALGRREDCTLRIVSATLKPSRAVGLANVEVGTVTTNAELRALYAEADLMVVPLTPNLHASGCTVLQEAALSGLPAVASDAGGLRAYFADDAVRFVPPGDPTALAAAVTDLLASPDERAAMAARAAARMGPHGLGAEAYVGRHVDLSRRLLGAPAPSVAGPAQPASVTVP